MNDLRDRTFDQLLDAWMDLGPTSAPDRVADAVRLEARTTRQTAIPPWWPPRRFLEMNNMLRVGLAAAAVVAAALIGYTYLVAPNVGTDAAEPTPSPEPTPIADLADVSGALSAGRYVITEIEPLRIALTVPSGWERLAVPAMVWSSEDTKTTVAYFTVDDLYADPCNPSVGVRGVGPSVDDLVTAFGNSPGISIESTADVRLAGHAGTQVDYTATDLGCEDEGALIASQPGSVDRPHPGGDAELLRLYVLDVDGVRLVISLTVPAGASEARAAEAHEIIASTQID